MSYSDEKIDVRGDGRIILYKRTHLKRPRWQARISVPNATGYEVVSTKKFDLDEAKRFAHNLYEELYMRVKAGGSLQSKTFKQVYAEWQSHVALLGKTRRDGSWDETVERIDSYALEFFGTKRIDAIKEADFSDYWAWRQSNFRKKAPTNATLRREKTSIMPIFKHALTKRYIDKIPTMNAPKAKSERRPTFTEKEWVRIRDASEEWVKKAEGTATWRDRSMAQGCFLVLAYTGLRIGELRDLRWSDLERTKAKKGAEQPGTYMTGRVTSGKTGGREFVFYPGSERIIERLYNRRRKELSAQNPDLENPSPPLDEFIFCHPDGRAIKSYKHSFHSLLEFAGIPIERDGKARTIYSLRHLYATRSLSSETNPFLLAKQMGTSVEMLEKHYGQVVTSSLAAEITKAEPFKPTRKTSAKFPFD